jgi:hypothetical protein
MTRLRRVSVRALLAGGLASLAIAGCGEGSHFKNKPRPATPLQITGVINNRAVSVEPARFGAGPVVINISNQTQQTHTVTLTGDNLNEQVGPVHPLDTVPIQVTLGQGEYTVRASSSSDTASSINPATLSVGPPRKSSSGTLLLP